LSGLAIIAKATGAIFLVALALAAMFRPEERRAVLAPGMLVSLVTGGLILAGPAIWAINNPDLATASLAKFKPGGGWPAGLAGLAWAIWATGGFVAVSTALAAAFTRRAGTGPMNAGVFRRAGAISILLIALAIVMTDSAELKERWLVPIAAPLTPLLLVWVMRRQGWMRFLPPALGGLAAAAMLATLSGYFRKNEPPPRTDFAALAATFRATGADVMLMPDDMAAGVAMLSPDLPVVQRVDHGAMTCQGRLLLAQWPGEDWMIDRLRARLAACDMREEPAEAAPGSGTEIGIRVFTLIPQTGPSDAGSP
jgi:hypothetical protein